MKTYTITLFVFLSLISQLKAQTCNVPDVQLYQWTAQQGTLPRFVVACLEKEGLAKKPEKSSPHRGFIIFLGQTNQGIYTIEGGQGSDAVENEAGFASLAFTPFKGTRKVFALYKDQPMDQLTEQIVLKKLWKWHQEGVYQVKDLKSISFTRNPAFNQVDPQLASSLPWMYQVVNAATQGSIRWNLQAKSSMCWCKYQWKVTKKAL